MHAAQALSYSRQLLSRSIRGWKGEEAHGDEYQFQLLHVGLVPQALPKVEAVHVLVNETERVCLSRIHPHEWCYIHIFVMKEARYVNFIVEPLQETSAEYSVQAQAVVATHRNDPGNIERHVGTI